MGKRDWIMTNKQENIYNNLWRQAEKVFDWRTHHQGKRGTERYRNGVKAFCKHLAVSYGSKNFKNISDKHLQTFVAESQKAGVGAATIKTDLSAIRKLHSLLPKTRYKLSNDNKQLKAEKRQIIGVDRAWKDSELKNAANLAKSMGRNDVNWALRCARTLGTRIEEVTALRKTQINAALEKNYINLTLTKGGIPRDVPLNTGARRVLTEMKEQTNGDMVFVRHGRTHKQAMKSIKNWITNNRGKFQESYQSNDKQSNGYEERPNLSFHGARHSYARAQYETRTKAGLDPKEARQQVAKLLGHGRDAVTRVYLGG